MPNTVLSTLYVISRFIHSKNYSSHFTEEKAEAKLTQFTVYQRQSPKRGRSEWEGKHSVWKLEHLPKETRRCEHQRFL